MRYKLGMSSLNDLSRMKAYKKGTRHIMICECENPFAMEKILIREFHNSDNCKLIAGNEYFEVKDELALINLFINTIMKYKNKQVQPETERVIYVKPINEQPAKVADWKNFAYRNNKTKNEPITVDSDCDSDYEMNDM